MNTNKNIETRLLEWNPGPANEGGGTAGGDRWWDGDHLLVIVETTSMRQISLVMVCADGDQLSFFLNGTDEIWEYDHSDIFWWARVDEATLPPLA